MTRKNAATFFLFSMLFGFLVGQLSSAQSAPHTPPAPRFLFPQLPVLNTPNQAVAADFNGDGNIDLAVTESSAVEVFLGNGNGTFRSPVAYTVKSGGAVAVAVGDMNNDGIPDLIVSGVRVNPSVSIFLGKGDGTFASPKQFPVYPSAGTIGLGDFNEDGNLDVIVNGRGSISILLGTVTAPFSRLRSFLESA